MIRMYGNIVQICKYRIDWTDEQENKFSEYAITEQDANSIAQKYNGTVTALDTSNENWLDGLTFESRDDALNWLDKGEQAYNEWILAKQSQSTESLLEQLTQTQIALTEVYEMMLTTGGA